MIYQIRNIVNDMVYVGQTIHPIKIRQHEHFRMLRQNIHHSNKLQNAFNKYGEAVFVVEVLDECNDNLNELERMYILNANSRVAGYNMNSGGQNGTVYFKTWIGLIDPTGIEIAPVENMAEFCRIHGLNVRAMRQMFAGGRYSHKGWRITGREPKTGYQMQLGQQHSPETKRKMSASAKNAWNTRKQILGG